MKMFKAVAIAVALAFVLTAPLPKTANAYLVELPGTAGQYQLYNSFPFARDYFGSGRYQQVYDSSLFSEKGFITSILFVPEYTGTYGANIQISLAYTSVSPGYLSTDLDSNIDGQAKVVLSDPSFSQSVTAGWYHLVIDLSSPTEFLYDPDKGNLLVDIVISDQSSNMGALKFYYPSGYTYQSSRAWNSSIVGNGNDSGTFPAALLTRFEFTPIPDVLTFFDENVAGGTLVGVGPGGSANAKLGAFRNMVEHSIDLIAGGKITGACQQLLNAMNLCDGIQTPPDFVGGEAVQDLWNLLEEIWWTLDCTNPSGQPFSPLPGQEPLNLGDITTAK